jgi:hemolysin activation/secretion protein
LLSSPAPVLRAAPQAFPNDAATLTFRLKNLRLVGETVFSAEQLRPLYQEYLGQTIRVETLTLIAQRLTQFYQQNGYPLSVAIVPPQEIAHGEASVRVVEGYIASVSGQESLRGVPFLKGALRRLLHARPLPGKLLESTVLRLNQLPGITVSSVLEPIDGQPGAFQLALQTVREEKRLSAQLDTHGSRATGPFQTTLAFDTPLTHTPLNGRIGLTCLGASPLQELRLCAAQSSVGLHASGTTASFSASTASSRPKSVFGDNVLESVAHSASITIEQPFYVQRNKQISASVGLSARSSEALLSDIRLYKDDVRSVVTGLNARFQDGVLGRYLFSIKQHHGVPWGNASDPSQQNTSRGGASRTFQKTTLSLARYQRLDDRYALIFGLEAQHSFDVLLSAEQFSYGGSALGRAYNASELLADKGVAGYAELTRDFLPPFKEIQFFAFADVGRVWSNTKEPAIEHAGSSAGAGLRWNSRSFSAALTAAQPLGLTPNDPVGGQDNGLRVLLSVQLRYDTF